MVLITYNKQLSSGATGQSFKSSFIHILVMKTAKAKVNLYGSKDSPEHPLIAIVSWLIYSATKCMSGFCKVEMMQSTTGNQNLYIYSAVGL